jgi:fumarylacetoacetase
MGKKKDGSTTMLSRIGDHIIDLSALAQLGYLNDLDIDQGVFMEESLNPFIMLGKKARVALRNRISELFNAEREELRERTDHHVEILFDPRDIEMIMPVEVGDYTDFYSSREHATNVGTMFRDPNNALLPNWLHIPVGYHGRASSIVVSGVPTIRPKGQTMPAGADKPVFGPSRLLDFELEMAFITCQGPELGESISTADAEDYIFGMVIFNDWSARDIQKWEYVPLGPFLAKNFASTISPWVITLEALDPFRAEGPVQEPEVLPYLKYQGKRSFDIDLEVYLQPENGEENKICHSNYKHLYWNMSQQLAHHTINGCNINAGDMMASGTISGPSPDSYGSMLELSWRGEKPLRLKDGSERKFIQDGDSVIMRAYCQNEHYRIGFGESRSKVLAAKI